MGAFYYFFSFTHSINQFPAKVAKVSQRSAKGIQSFTHSIIQSFNQSVSRKGRKGFAEGIQSFTHSLIQSFTHSFNHSLIQSFSFPQRSQRFRRGAQRVVSIHIQSIIKKKPLSEKPSGDFLSPISAVSSATSSVAAPAITSTSSVLSWWAFNPTFRFGQ